MGVELYRDTFLSTVAWPLKRVVRQLVREDFYQQARQSLLHQERGLGLDWRWGNSLRTVHPIRRDFGWQAGQTIHRYYTDECFLPRYANDIHGHVLEIADARYTKRFGVDKVVHSDILHAPPGNDEATIVADLTCAPQIPSHTYDCVILTFTLQFLYEVKSALKTLHRILKPGGVLLIAVPGISQIARYDDDHWGEYWRFTSRSLRILLGELFSQDAITVQSYGNVLTALASLHGLNSRELKSHELNHRDRDYEVTVTARAVK